MGLYNNVRLHSAIQYITPNDKLHGREKAILDERDRKLDEARARRAQRRQEARETFYNNDARPEDKALLASTLSAVPGPEARQGDQPSPSPSTTLLLAESEKRNSENTAFSPLHPLVTC